MDPCPEAQKGQLEAENQDVVEWGEQRRASAERAWEVLFEQEGQKAGDPQPCIWT